MKKGWIYLFAGLVFVMLLAGCGSKTKEEVIQELNKKTEELKGYKLDAKMTLTMGNEAQEYQIEVWHNKPELYRVHMKNAERDQSQMILRNKEGVYVLTPALNKSYKFRANGRKTAVNHIYTNRLYKIY